MKLQQKSFFKEARKSTLRWWVEKQFVYGGSLNYRKVERPFDSKKLVHVVLKARLGKAIWFTRSEKSIAQLLKQAAFRYNLKVKSFSIQKDHIHLLVYPKSFLSPLKARKNFQNFLRFFSAEMGRKYKRIMRILGLHQTRNLWVSRPVTRLVSWGKKSLKAILKYIQKNTLEALGFIEYSSRNHKINQFLKKFSGEWLV